MSVRTDVAEPNGPKLTQLTETACGPEHFSRNLEPLTMMQELEPALGVLRK